VVGPTGGRGGAARRRLTMMTAMPSTSTATARTRNNHSIRGHATGATRAGISRKVVRRSPRNRYGDAMAESPFPFHGPLAPDRVRGRDDIIADLVERVTNRRPTVLVAPRRFGKTSVLGAVTQQLADTTTAIWVDLYELRSWADLAARLDDALTTVTGDRRRMLDRLAAGLELNLGVVKASLSRPERPEPDITADRLLDLLVR